MRIRDLMTPHLYALKPTDSVHDAKVLMSDKRIRHVPVVDDEGNFQGLVTQRDVLAAGLSRFADADEATRGSIESGLPLREIMTTEVICGTPQTTVREAAKILMDNKIGCLPVLEGRKPVGIVTEADFMKLVVDLLDSLGKMP